ncbi:MAG: response regulator [Alphaproteobacteria bacterium]|nr:response regulator [Alphaproteobacteria bacterium]
MTSSPTSIRKSNVLVIEDNTFQRALLAETLRSIGAGRIETAETFEFALEMCKHFVPSLILCNWSPEFDGIAFTKALRRGETILRKQTPLIMVTAQATGESVEIARRAGVDEYVIKPFNTGSLVSRIDAVLYRRRPFIDSPIYAGPCRRRKLEVDYEGPRRRLFDEEETGKDSPEIELKKQLAKSQVNRAREVLRDLTPGERTKIREIYSIGKEILEIAASMDDKLLRVAGESLVAYIEGVGASSMFDPKVVDAHVDAMAQLIALPNVQGEMREAVSRALSAMVRKKLSAGR